MKRRAPFKPVMDVIMVVLFVNLMIQGLCDHWIIALILMGCMIALPVIYTAVCWLGIPPDRRTRPPVPEDFKVVRLGPVDDAITALLNEAAVIGTSHSRGGEHLLYRIARSFPDGTWNCSVDIADGSVNYYRISFFSAVSPVLDKGWGRWNQRGKGFLSRGDAPAKQG